VEMKNLPEHSLCLESEMHHRVFIIYNLFQFASCLLHDNWICNLGSYEDRPFFLYSVFNMMRCSHFEIQALEGLRILRSGFGLSVRIDRYSKFQVPS